MKIDTEKLLLFIRQSNPRCLLLKNYEVQIQTLADYKDKNQKEKKVIFTNCVFENSGHNENNSSLYARESKKIKVGLDEFNEWCRFTFFRNK